MPVIDNIVQVLIDLQTSAVSQAGFGTLLFLGDSDNFGGDRVRVYDSIDAVGADFVSTDPEYIAANTYFAQSPNPAQIKIGTLLAGDSGNYTTALDAIVDVDDDWYVLAIESRAIADQEGVANWVESRRKLFALASNDSDIIDLTEGADNPTTGSIFARLNLTNFRTFGLYNEDAGTGSDLWAEVAWVGEQLTRDPGSSTWAFKSLSLIAPSNLSPTQAANALSKNGNVYQLVGGVPITRGGVVFGGTDPSGEYIDVMRGIDWLQARMTERVFSRLVNLPKVPYTDGGVSIIVAEVKAQLDAAIIAGVLAQDPLPTVTAPLVKNVPINDKALRQLPDVKFQATLEGAIHKVVVQGVVTL